MTPTPEQDAIRKADYKSPGLTVVNAYAGTGKTSTLKMICDENPRARILYLCYNKALSEEAKLKFPGVEVRTTHSLAYGKMLPRFGEKMRKPGMRPAEIAQRLRIDRRLAVAVRDTLARFLSRPGPELDECDIPPELSALVDVKEVVAATGRLWSLMKDPKDPAPMPHDGYLKIWVDEGATVWHDIVLLDEAQDTSQVVEEFVVRQTARKAVCLVGDAAQAIYSWRGCVDAMARATDKAKARFALTTAFRLREPAAKLATELVNFTGDPATIIPGNDGPFGVKGGPPCVVARTNAFLLREAFMAVARGELPHFVGTKVEQRYDPSFVYDFEEILDIDRLRRGERTTTRYISFFESWEQFASVADPNSPSGIVDRDHVLAFELVREFGDKLREIVELVRTESVGPADADVILTTCHKAKGLEWDVVRMLADFPSLDQISQMREKAEMAAAGIGGKGKKVRNWREEANILYVGLTRARDELTPPPNLRDGPAGVASGSKSRISELLGKAFSEHDEDAFDDWSAKGL